MRTASLLALLVALSACSEVDPGFLGFRVVASDVVDGWPAASVAVARTPAEAEALAETFGLDTVPTADFAAREALVAVATPGACPATNYAVLVDHIEVYPGRTRVSAFVELTADAPGRQLAHPVQVVAVTGLGDAEPTVTYHGEADACTLE